MARKLKVAHHLKRVKGHHKRHRKRLLKLYHKVRQHPGCYKPGYGPKRRAKVPKSLPRTRPRGLNKKGAGFIDGIKSAWKWLTGHGKKIAKDVGKEVAKHAAVHGKALMEEGKRRAVEYGKAQVGRVTEWGKGQLAAAEHKIRKKVEKHISDASNKVESIANRVNKGVSKYTGQTTGMPGRTVSAKTGDGWLGDRFRAGVGRAARGIWRMGTRRRR